MDKTNINYIFPKISSTTNLTVAMMVEHWTRVVKVIVEIPNAETTANLALKAMLIK